MPGFEFIWPDQAGPGPARLEELRRRFNLPAPYYARDATTAHLKNAVYFTVLEMALSRYVETRTRRPFDCLSYYCDAPNVTAYGQRCGEGYVVTMGVPFVRKLAMICGRIGAATRLWPRAPAANPRGRPEQDDELTRLLTQEVEVGRAEADRLIAAWPAASTEFQKIGLGDYALFYDLIRLIWTHEWAHALCGHVALGETMLGLSAFHEVSAERLQCKLAADREPPATLVFQNLELYADQAAIGYCTRAILKGQDPVGTMAGLADDLCRRLVLLNMACGIVALFWWAEELRQITRDQPLKATHPPAALRYLRFRTFQRMAVVARAKSDPTLPLRVDAESLAALNTLASRSGVFSSLFEFTPVIHETPSMQDLDAYEVMLLTAWRRVSHRLDSECYELTVDPYRRQG
jgi:hypothetical protein